jgi:hypothetical protein
MRALGFELLCQKALPLRDVSFRVSALRPVSTPVTASISVRGEVVAEAGCRFIVHGARCDGPRGLTEGKDALAWFMRGEWGVRWCCVRAKVY